jgi:uncharacterized membrane protein
MSSSEDSSRKHVSRQRDDEAFHRRGRIRRRQNNIAVGVYAVSTVVALFSPIVAILLFTAVALAYVAPTVVDRGKE